MEEAFCWHRDLFTTNYCKSGSRGLVPALQWHLAVSTSTLAPSNEVVCLWWVGGIYVCDGSVGAAWLRWDSPPASCRHATWPGPQWQGCCSWGRSPSACRGERTPPAGCCPSSPARQADQGSARTEQPSIVIDLLQVWSIESLWSLHNGCECLSALSQQPRVTTARATETQVVSSYGATCTIPCYTAVPHYWLQTWRPSCLARRGSPPSNTIWSNVVWSPNNKACQEHTKLFNELFVLIVS